MALIAAVSIAAMAVAGLNSKKDLNASKDAALRAFDFVQAGNFAEARTELRTAGRLFRSADRRLDRWPSLPALLIPVVAQHVRELVELSETGAGVSSQVEQSLAAVDLEALKPVRGKIDLAAVTRASGPIESSSTATEQLHRLLERTLEDGWIAAPSQRRLRPPASRVQRAENDGKTAVLAAKAGRSMLGVVDLAVTSSFRPNHRSRPARETELRRPRGSTRLA